MQPSCRGVDAAKQHFAAARRATLSLPCNAGFLTSLLAEQALDVPGDQVHLEVDGRAAREPPERRHALSVRDEKRFEEIGLDAIHREAHAVDTDGALARDKAAELAGHAHAQ